jgi:hypothetical protein
VTIFRLNDRALIVPFCKFGSRLLENDTKAPSLYIFSSNTRKERIHTYSGDFSSSKVHSLLQWKEFSILLSSQDFFQTGHFSHLHCTPKNVLFKSVISSQKLHFSMKLCSFLLLPFRLKPFCLIAYKSFPPIGSFSPICSHYFTFPCNGGKNINKFSPNQAYANGLFLFRLFLFRLQISCFGSGCLRSY